MIPRVYVDGEDVSSAVLFDSLAIRQDSTTRLATAEFTVRWPGGEPARWDSAQWDVDRWSFGLAEIVPVQIYDVAPAPKVLRFGGQMTYFSYERIAPGTLLVHCQCQDYAVWLENTVVPYEDLGTTHSDQYIIQYLINTYAAGRLNASGVQQVLATVPLGVIENQTLRQVIDWLTDLSNAHWHVDPDGTIVYREPDAIASPYSFSDQPDHLTSFPFSIRDFSRDFARPVNHAIVTGAILADGSNLRVEYEDPVSIGKYGRYTTATLDRQLTDANEARLRAEAIVEDAAFPKQSGSLVTYADVFRVGDYVVIDSVDYSLYDSFILHSCDIKQINRTTTEYTYGFGPQPPDAARLLVQLERWMRTESGSGIMQSGPPPPGSVTNESLAPGFSVNASQISSVNASAIAGMITATQIGSVSAGTITGTIVSTQIGSVSAGTIIGQVVSSQIGSVAATVIQGAITAGQIGSVNATVIQGVVVSSQLADAIINDLSKYAAALRPIPTIKDAASVPVLPSDNFPPGSFFFYEVNGHFFQINPDGLGWTDVGTDGDVLGAMRFYHIGTIAAKSITGLILAAQIQSITAGQITGQIQAAQIQAVNASAIVGTITAAQIASVNASAIQGTITSAQIGSIDASKITGTIVSTQIGSVSASTITGTVIAEQIGSVNATTITVGLIAAGQIGSVNANTLNAGTIKVGGGGSKPGKLEVYNSSGVVIGFAGVSGTDEGGYFKTLGVGGTQAAPVIKADAAGAVSILNANFTISAGANGTLDIKTNQFDPAYTSVGVKVRDSLDFYKTWLVSKGVVGYNQTESLFSLNLVPSDSVAGECVIYRANAKVIHLDGSAKVVRSELGYECGGYMGKGTGPTQFSVGYVKSTGGNGTMWFAGGLLVALT